MQHEMWICVKANKQARALTTHSLTHICMQTDRRRTNLLSWQKWGWSWPFSALPAYCQSCAQHKSGARRAEQEFLLHPRSLARSPSSVSSPNSAWLGSTSSTLASFDVCPRWDNNRLSKLLVFSSLGRASIHLSNGWNHARSNDQNYLFLDWPGLAYLPGVFTYLRLCMGWK